jgi:hypothetical protein
MWWRRPKAADNQYLVPNRLADVLALIQVLALDEHAHRSEEGLDSELQGAPKSGGTWTDVARMHPEFFRLRPESTHGVSLISRHVLPKDAQGIRRLPSDFVGQLIAAAVDLYDRQVKRSERWTYLVPIWVALVVGVFGLLGVVLKAMFQEN